MTRTAASRRMNSLRHGTTVVETAIVLPVFLLFVLALIELGNAQMVKHVLRGACRQAARIGATEGNSTAGVRQRALDVLASCMDVELVDVYVKDASAFDGGASPPESGADLESLPDVELSDAAPRQLFLVRAKVNYEDIAIVPNIPVLGNFLDDLVLEGQAFMRHE